MSTISQEVLAERFAAMTTIANLTEALTASPRNTPRELQTSLVDRRNAAYNLLGWVDKDSFREFYEKNPQQFRVPKTSLIHPLSVAREIKRKQLAAGLAAAIRDVKQAMADLEAAKATLAGTDSKVTDEVRVLTADELSALLDGTATIDDRYTTSPAARHSASEQSEADAEAAAALAATLHS